MHIVYAANVLLPSKVAGSVHVMKMCHAFCKNGHELTLVTRGISVNQDETISSIDPYKYYDVDPIFKIKQNSSHISIFKIGILLSLIKSFFYILKTKLDLVYGRDLQLCFLLTLFGKKTVFEIHQPIDDLGRLNKYMFNYLVYHKKCVKIVVITKSLLQWYSKKYTKNVKKFYVAADGADPLKCKSEKDIDKKISIGYVGHFYKGKGLEIISNLPKVFKGVDFYIIGGTGEELIYWKKELGTMKNVYMPGHVNQKKVKEYLCKFDIVLAPFQNTINPYGNSTNISNWTSPLKVFEYMSSGAAIIASDLPVLKEILDNDINCIMCEHDNVNDWIKAIERLSNDRSLMLKISTNAKIKFLKEYTWASRADNIMNELFHKTH